MIEKGDLDRLCIGLFLVLFGCAEPVQDEASLTQFTESGGHIKMVSLLEELATTAEKSDPFVGTGELEELRLNVERQGGANIGSLAKLAQAELIHGNEMEAVSHYEKVVGMLESEQPTPKREKQITQLKFHLAVACLRLGETENCCLRHTPDSCILPIRGGGIHTETTGSEKAVRYLSEVLQHSRGPSQYEMFVEARWLLNIACMTLGKYPEGVPPEYRIPEEKFGSSDMVSTSQRLNNVAHSVGIDTFDLAGSVVVDDFTGDGYLDVFFTSFDLRGQLRFYVNEGGVRFVEKTEDAGLMGIVRGLNAVHADYDNDGDLDLLVLRGAWRFADGKIPNSLLQNDGSGNFQDVTFEAGLGDVHYPTQAAAWADYDNDGDLDLYIGNESTIGITRFDYYGETLGAKPTHAPSQLFRNNGDGTFTDVAAEAGVENSGYAKGVVWGDYNGDRFPDIYVSNIGTENRLYRNNRDGTFSNIAAELKVTRPLASFPAWFWDVDNDGALDLFVSSYSGGFTNVVAETKAAEESKLYKGDGAGGFKDVASDFGLNRVHKPMGANFGDLNGDGFLDFYLGTGDPNFKVLIPNRMFLNSLGKEFTDASFGMGLAHLQKGHGVAFADWDHDGDLDVFQQIGGAYPGDKYPNALFNNPGTDRHFIAIELTGVQSNRSAIGSRITVFVSEKSSGRQIVRFVDSGGSFGANPLRQYFGIGLDETIDRVDVFWPTTGKTQTFSKIQRNAILRIREGDDSIEKLVAAE